MAKDNLAQQTDNVLLIIKEKPQPNLPIKTNNWMGVQGGGDWEGLSDNQLHITRALRKNNKPELTMNQIFFETDGWAEDKESYKMDMMSKGFTEKDTFDVMDRDQMTKLIKFISNHEMGPNQYNQLKNVDKTINKALDRAYDYVLSDDYSLKELIK